MGDARSRALREVLVLSLRSFRDVGQCRYTCLMTAEDSAAIRATTTIRDVRPWGAERADVEIVDGVIAAVRAHDRGASAEPGDLSGDGRLAFPSFTDAHVHLDSTRVGLPFRPHTAMPGPLWNLIQNDRENWRDAGATVAERAALTLGSAISHGLTRARSYAQVDVDCRLERLEGVLAAREEHRDRADVEVVAFPQAGLLREAGSAQLIDAAMRAGADVVGGIDPCGLDADPVRHLDLVFELAECHQAPIDLHLHEPGELGLFSIRLFMERVRAHGLRSRTTLAHAFTLGASPGGQVAPVLDELAEWDVAVTTVAPGRVPALPLAEMARRGIRTGLGQDGQRDYWSPYGSTDMLDRAWQLAFTSGFRHDDLVEHCLAVATVGGASVIDPAARRLAGTADRPGIDAGDVADLVIVPGDAPTAAVMDRPGDRVVIRRGVVVAEDGVLR